LKSQAKSLEANVPESERMSFLGQLQRLEDHLNANPPQTRSVLFVVGPQTWQVVPLHVHTDGELLWGLPSLTQLLWPMAEHRPSGIVLLDKSGARFFHNWMGEITEVHENASRLIQPSGAGKT
jgi:hypothetical protein